jgi:adenosyl cobinamide kinase/adenosyl cobinamide phosphate guanylyltransferase
VASLGYEPRQTSTDPTAPSPVLLGLEEALRAGDLDDEALACVLTKDVVVCCEVGQGVVPVDRGNRDWRERVGRTCTKLAAEATRVVRMVCGIPMVLKGDEV